MDSVSVIMPITIKAKLTEKLKSRMVDELTNAIKQTDMEISQIDAEERRVLAEEGHNDIQRIQAIRQHFGIEREKRQEFKADTEKRLEDTNHLAIGAEVVQGRLERVTEVKIGDNLRDMMNVEILVEDDKVIAVRS